MRSPKKSSYLWGLKEDHITEGPKENPINEKPKEDPRHCEISEYAQELQDPQWLLGRKLTLFGFLVKVYDRVDDGDTFSKKYFVLGRIRFHATSHLKIAAKVFLS